MMGRKFKLFKHDDDDDIGIAVSSLVSGVITLDEFKEWVYYVISETDDISDLPTYFFQLVDAKDKADITLRGHRIIGFTPGWNLKREESKALDGIGYKRFSNFHSDFVGRDAALRALEKNPHIEKLFRETFPFLDF